MKKKKLALTMAIAITLTVSSISGSMPTFVYAQENTNVIENEENVVESASEETQLQEEAIEPSLDENQSSLEETATPEKDVVDTDSQPQEEMMNEIEPVVQEKVADEETENNLQQESWKNCDKCTQNEPHIISTVEDLDKIRTHTTIDESGNTIINGYFKLANDIVFAEEDFQVGGKFYNDGRGWTPIGSREKTGQGMFNNVDCFTGEFNGNSHSITNLKMNRQYNKSGNYYYNGLFSSFTGKAYVHDLVLDSFYFEAKGAGLLSGRIYSPNVNVENIRITNSTLIDLGSNIEFSGLLTGGTNGNVRNIQIENSFIKNATRGLRTSFITGSITGGIVENVKVYNCKLEPYALGGIVTSLLSGNPTIKNIDITNSTLNLLHQDWNYIFNTDNRSSNSKDIPEISNINIDIKVDFSTRVVGRTGYITMPISPVGTKLVDTNNVNINFDYDNNQIVNLLQEKNVVYFQSNIDDTQKCARIQSQQIGAYLNGGTLPEGTVFEENKLVSPKKEGHKFAGWYDNKDFSGTPATTPEVNKTYYAKWEEKKDSTISFQDNLKLDKTYDGKAVSISENAYTVTDGAGEVTFSYQVKNGAAWADVNDVPTNVGTYRVKAVVAENDNYKGAETDWKEFIIRKATPAYTLPNDLVVGKGKTLATVTLPKGFTWADETQTADELGTYEFKAVYTPEDTANYETVEVMIAVEVVPNTSLINHAPEIEVSDRTLTVGDAFDPMENVVVKDKEDSADDLVVDVTHHVDTSKAGIYEVTYKVTDTKGAVTMKTITVTVKEKSVDKPTTSGKSDHTTKPDGTTKAKKAGAPKTGDMTNVGVFASMLAGSSGVLAVLLGKRRKDNKNK